MYPTDPLVGLKGNSEPKTLTIPDMGFIRPAIVLTRVVFPTPEGPVMATISPGKISRLGISTRGLLLEYPILTPSRYTLGFTIGSLECTTSLQLLFDYNYEISNF
jgi:hypothetical protein